MVIEIESGRYLHTAYAISDVAEELLPDEWSTTERADGMDYVGTYTDDSPTDSTDATDYVWEEIYDLDVDDTDEDDEMPVAEEQSQIASVEERLNILEQDSENLNEAIDNLNTNVGGVSSISSDAMDIAQATGQHFWADTDGVHISDEQGNAEGERNSLWNSLGMLFRKGANILLAILTGGASGTGEKGVALYDGSGNSDSNITAKFTDQGATIGKDSGSQAIVQASGFTATNVNGDRTFTVKSTGITVEEDFSIRFGEESEQYVSDEEIPFDTPYVYVIEDTLKAFEDESDITVMIWRRNPETFDEVYFNIGTQSTQTVLSTNISYDGDKTLTLQRMVETPVTYLVLIEYTRLLDAPSLTLGTRKSDNISGGFSSTQGLGLIADLNYLTVVGKYNTSGAYHKETHDANADLLFAVGGGINNETRFNVFEVNDLGEVLIYQDLYIRENKMETFVVETGTTSNNWDYRLWSDGTYEAWRSHGFTGMALTSSSAGTFYGGGTTLGVPTFPNNDNTGVLQCICSANGSFSHSSGVYLYQVLHSNATTPTATMTFQFRAHASTQSASCGLDIYLKGTYS